MRSGKGFAIIRGLPVDGSLDGFVAAVRETGRHFGHLLSQNAQGELVGHVVDATKEDPTPRMYRSNLELRPHSDITAMLALACWQKAHRPGEEGPGEEPVTPYRVPVFSIRKGQLSCRYQRAAIAAGHRELGVPLTAQDIDAFNLFDEVAKAPENRLAFHLERGDMLVLNNYTILHAPGFRDVPKEFNLFKTNGVPRQEGRRGIPDIDA